MFAMDSVLCIVGVVDGERVVAIGKVGEQQLAVAFGLIPPFPSRIHEVHVVVHLIGTFIVGELCVESLQGVFGQCEVFQLVLVDDTGIEERLLQ